MTTQQPHEQGIVTIRNSTAPVRAARRWPNGYVDYRSQHGSGWFAASAAVAQTFEPKTTTPPANTAAEADDLPTVCPGDQCSAFLVGMTHEHAPDGAIVAGPADAGPCFAAREHDPTRRHPATECPAER